MHFQPHRQFVYLHLSLLYSILALSQSPFGHLYSTFFASSYPKPTPISTKYRIFNTGDTLKFVFSESPPTFWKTGSIVIVFFQIISPRLYTPILTISMLINDKF